MKNIRILKQEALTIEKGVILSKDSFIQIKNITRVWFGRLPVEVPVSKILFVLAVGLGLLSTALFIGVFVVIGTLMMVAYYIYMLNHYCLSFELTSGQIYAFTTIEKEFLEESYNEVKNIMKNKTNSDEGLHINFSSCKINVVNDNNGTINFSDVDNSVHNNVDSNNFNSFNTKIDFDSIGSELLALLDKVRNVGEEKDIRILELALDLAVKKNEKGLKELLKKLSINTIRIIEVSSAFVTLFQFLK